MEEEEEELEKVLDYKDYLKVLVENQYHSMRLQSFMASFILKCAVDGQFSDGEFKNLAEEIKWLSKRVAAIDQLLDDLDELDREKFN